MIDVIKNGPEEERQKLAKENGKYYIVLDAMNPFYRRLMYQEVEKQYKDLISLAKLDKDNKVPSPRHLQPARWRRHDRHLRFRREGAARGGGDQDGGHSPRAGVAVRQATAAGGLRDAERPHVLLSLVRRPPARNLPEFRHERGARLPADHRRAGGCAARV